MNDIELHVLPHRRQHILMVSDAGLIDMIHGHCLTITMFCAPDAPFYVVDQIEGGLQGFGAAAVVLNNAHALGTYQSFHSGYVYGVCHEASSFLRTWAAAVNELPADYGFVSQEWWTRRLVYQSLVLYNNFKVRHLDAKAAKYGLHFGSETAWHTEDMLLEVRGWPERWPRDFDPGSEESQRHENPGVSSRLTFPKMWNVEPLVMPCNRPDYQQRLAAERAANKE